MTPRCVLVLDPAAPRWLIANASAVLATTPAAEVHIHGPALLGPDRLVRGLTRGTRALGDPVTEAVR